MQSAGPSQTITISGTVVGILDPTQATRLLSSPGSRLAFATFDPKTASVVTRKLSVQDELCGQKRVVIETLLNGENFWRWVPRAKGVDSAGGEGSWPRVISICGQLVECSQDQWDIYKLDPEYECFVRPEPELTTITRRESKETSDSTENVPSNTIHQKRYVDNEYEGTVPQAKRKRTVIVVEESEDADSEDEDAVEEMIIDGAIPGAWSERRKQFSQRMTKDRARRREKTAAKANKEAQKKDLRDASDLSMIDLTLDEPDTETQTQTGGSTGSQPSYSFSQTPSQFSQSSAAPNIFSGGSQGSSNGATFVFKRAAEFPEMSGTATKRQRTRSPSPTFGKGFNSEMKNFIERRRQEARRSRLRRTRARATAQKESQQHAWEGSFRASAQATFVPSRSQSTSYSPFDGTPSSRTASQPAEMEDPISLEEKIRRMAEINAYEEARVAKELERQRAEQAAEERKRKQEEQRAREKVRLEREAREREAELERQRQRRQEEQERREREQEHEELKRRMQQQQDRWSYGVWTTQRALERYRVLSETFDTIQFSVENPVQFVMIPWPVLHKPAILTIEDVDWNAVEAFFKAIRPHLRTHDYNTLVEKSHRRFHPDRWRARRVLQSVQDEELKACLEVAANTVAQALTPIWREAKKA
ncbi:hypothetical protein BDY19DRAFT_398310 [Irpex rosettiformis]|uniref:Uncharacterized protein n=1 Tax=Irpex rosettiformis TaxID=378272 RepID=A0ACB8UEW5_9APHY|nr:hypothetical protein BDY19DRAFT_398310 [Irpex rosettiformis]